MRRNGGEEMTEPDGLSGVVAPCRNCKSMTRMLDGINQTVAVAWAGCHRVA
jgi:hypothetical protein